MGSMMTDLSFDYQGDPSLREPIAQALYRVVDPEVALSIVDVGLIYAVTVSADKVHVLMTMTSAACPVTDMILDDVESQLDQVVPRHMRIETELCWEPAWSPDRMSPSARRMMQG
ncbi:MAG: metal-sulfur cluster assembly factor [Burkholderiales bacterium]|nr:metal-sulfur cluster assembly factor [Burkholderiales bacterium]MDE2078605.1 metal-sulfur cluster assembly factor [Burkholderiales bacterium]